MYAAGSRDIAGRRDHPAPEPAADPGFLAAVLDYILADEPLLIGFSAEHGLAPERVAAARRAMDGP